MSPLVREPIPRQPYNFTSSPTKHYFAGGAYEVTVDHLPDPDETTTKKYYNFAGMLVAMHDGTNLTYFAQDHLSSTSIVMDNTGGLLSQNRYMPFGEVRDITGSNDPINETDFTYTGQRNLAGMSLMDYKARFYSPLLGRFIQPDTIIPNPGNPQSFNRYSYVNNNPLKYNDPSGHWLDTAIDIISIGVGIKDIADNGLNWSNGLGLVADVVSLALPVVAGGGTIVRALTKADDVVDVLKGADRAKGVAKHFNKAVDAVKSFGRGAKSKIDDIWGAGKSYLKKAKSKIDDFFASLCSFSGDTRVITISGYEEISEVEIGEWVLAYDEETGETLYYQVTAVWVHEDPVTVHLTIDGELIETTPEHPFYTASGEWVESGALQPGDRVRNADGSFGVVQNIEVIYQTQWMYNITVDIAHTYFVGDGQWLVHNYCDIDVIDDELDLLNKKLASAQQMGEEGRIFAGEGADAPFRDANKWADDFGGNPDSYVKKTSSSYETKSGYKFETHWVENIDTGSRYNYKTKLYFIK